MTIRMRSFGLVAMLVLAACTKPEPQPVAPLEEPQPELQPEPQAAPEPAQQSTVIESGNVAATPSDDDPTARIANCKLVEAWDERIRVAAMRRDELRRQLEGEAPIYGVTLTPLQVNPPRNLESNPVYQNPVYQTLRMQYSTVEVEIAELRAERSVREQLQNQIESYKKQLDDLRVQYTDKNPRVVALRETLDRLVQRALNECVEQIQKDSPGHI